MRPRSRELALLREDLAGRIRFYDVAVARVADTRERLDKGIKDKSTREDVQWKHGQNTQAALEAGAELREVIGALLVVELGEKGGARAGALYATGPWADMVREAPGLASDAQLVEQLRHQMGPDWPRWVVSRRRNR